jgi:hypothetical protein
MTMPNVGVNNVIQKPGFGAVMGQQLGGIAQMLQQMEEFKRQQAKDEAYNAYLDEQIKSSQARTKADAERVAEAKREKAATEKRQRELGGAVRDYTTGTKAAAIDVPTLDATGGVSGPAIRHNVKIPKGMEDVVSTLPPEVVPEFLKMIAPERQSREEKAAMARSQQAVKVAMRDLDPELRPLMSSVLTLKAAGAPAEVLSSVYSSMSQRIQGGEGIDNLRRKYPEYADLPDELVLKAYLGRLTAQTTARYRAPTGASKPDTRTPAEIKGEMSALRTPMSAARSELRRPRPAGRNNIPLKDDDPLVRQFVGDSTQVANDLAQFEREYGILNEELRQVQGSPLAQPPVVTAPLSPTETESVDLASGRRIATDSTTGRSRYLEPPKEPPK